MSRLRPPPQMSRDAKFYWSGNRWVAVREISPDGKWFWDGSHWRPMGRTKKSFWWPLIPAEWTNWRWWMTFAWFFPIVLFAISWAIYFATHHHF